MRLNEIFQKPVDRPIEGVIKADDQVSLHTEIEEYVLTNEVEKRLEAFLSAYNNYQGANGVWISGFFGSGKSHLLKMLAYLLESGAAHTADILESLLEKCGDNEILRAEIKSAVAIPSKSILFNIDQKADIISKDDSDALLSVFVKVLNEMQGYYGKQGYIAQFEREMDERGIYSQFKESYETIAGLTWENGREQSILEGSNIAEAYAAVTGQPIAMGEDILNKYRDSYRVSIEDFAEMVDSYIRRTGSKFRLNFFVDEVGQYIAGNVKLMTNLQTIAESLATKSRGRAWVIVTAQEDMQSVLGDGGKQQGNDFSKIQARFSTRMKLTSQDVAEVIQKRLLAKNETGIMELSRLYQEQANNFKTLFDFADGSQSYRNFKDQDNFTNSYPFIPYQFGLFQAAIQGLSAHNAFEGKHSSVGERSMLGVFQQVAKQISDHRIGQLATFDLMFEGIRSSLKTSIQQSIIVAEQNLENPFAISLLKALFLVKYVKEFKATERNLSVLMTERFGADMSNLRKQVEEALNILEQQTYVQRNGALYEYLTDEEKDVEEEIKTTDVETSTVVNELGTIVFDRIIKETKLRSEDGQHEYAFTRILDGRQFKGKTNELAIHVITPFNEHAANLPVVISQSMGRDELLVVMPPDDRLVRDLRLYEQTEKYVQQNLGTAQTDQIKMILTNKQYQNGERRTEIEAQINQLVSNATFIVSGKILDLNGSDAQSKVVRGFQQLVSTTYTNLKMLSRTVYKDADLGKYIHHSDGLFANDAVDLAESERELLNYVALQKTNGVRVTLKTLDERFERKPYGWYTAAILVTVAKLYARGRLEIRQDGNALEGVQLEQALLNAQVYPNLILTPQEEFTTSQVRALKDFFNDFFDKPPTSEEAKELATQTKDALAEQEKKLSELASMMGRYPFLKALEPVIARLRAVSGKPYSWYLTDFHADAEALLDLKEDIASPIQGFMSGGQRQIFDAARDFLIAQQANFQSVGFDEALEIREQLDDLKAYRGDTMRQVKSQMDGLQAKIDAELIAARATAVASITELRQRLEKDDKFKQLTALRQQDLLESFRDITGRLQQYTVIASVSEEARRFRNDTFTQLLIQMEQGLQSAAGADNHQPPQPVQYVRRDAIHVRFDKLALESDADVDTYLNRLRDAYLEQIRGGKRIQL